MGKSLLNADNISSLGSAQTRDITINGAVGTESTEVFFTNPVRYANATITNLVATVSANTLSGGTGSSTIRMRVAAANGNNSLSVTNGSTGIFEDASSSDSITTGQKINYQIVTGGTSGSISTNIGCSYDSATDTVARLCSNSSGGATYALSSTAAWFGFGSLVFESTTEAKVKTRLRGAFSAKNMRIYVSSNSRLTSTAVNTRVNSATGNLAISVATITTGEFEDTTHTDSIASGDDLNFEILGGAEVTNFVIRSASLELISTAGEFAMPATFTTGTSVGSGNTRYFCILGNLNASATETDKQIRANFAFTAKRLWVYVSVFAGTSGTARLRINAANSALVISTNGTGLFEDTTNSSAVVSEDVIDFVYVTVGGAQTITAFGLLGASSTTFNDSTAESATATDAQSAIGTYPGTAAESATATDAQSAAATYPGTVSESATATDAVSAVGTYPGTVSESATASDSQSSTASFSASTAESAMAADAQSANAVFGPSAAETATASDTQSASALFAPRVAESVVATDACSATVIFAVSRSESVTAIDSQNAGGQPPPPPTPGGGAVGGGGASVRGRRNRPLPRVPRYDPNYRQPNPEPEAPRLTTDQFIFSDQDRRDEEDLMVMLSLWLTRK